MKKVVINGFSIILALLSYMLFLEIPIFSLFTDGFYDLLGGLASTLIGLLLSIYSIIKYGNNILGFIGFILSVLPMILIIVGIIVFP